MPSAWKITKSQINELLEALIGRYDVFAPVPKGSQYAFGKIENAAMAALDYDATILPPRKFFLPPQEELFQYQAPGGDVIIPEKKLKPRVIFGIHTYDLHGIGVLKSVFMGVEQPDPYFSLLFNSSYLVGIDHRDDEFKFTRDMKTDGLNCEYDLFLGNYGQDYILLLGRERGNELIADLKADLTPVDTKELESYLKQREAGLSKKPLKLLAEVDEFPVIMPAVQDSIVWQQEADKCFSCGSCNTTCPTCYCFDIRDVPDNETIGGMRMRSWDSCMLSVFARVATGENFRESAHQRLKHRFNRKVWYLREKYKRAACVGCGRCSRACKADINIVRILNKLKEEYNFACSVNYLKK